MSTKTVHTFFLISRLPWGLGIQSWTFLNCPFLVEFTKHDTVAGGSEHTGSFFAHMFVGQWKVTYLWSLNQILISNPTSLWKNEIIHMRSSEILKKKVFLFWSNSPILSKGSITLKIFLEKSSKRARRSLDTVWVVPEAYVLKLPIFIAQRLALHQNAHQMYRYE